MGQEVTLVKSPIGKIGSPADSDSMRSRIEGDYRVENNEDIMPGLILAKGTGDKDVKLPTTVNDIIVGLVYNGGGRRLDPDTGILENYKQGDLVSIATEKVFYGYTETAASKGDQVFVRYASGAGGTQKGYTRTDADTTTAVAINAKFDETVTAAGPIKIKLHLEQV
jgi:hypothetical protein